MKAVQIKTKIISNKEFHNHYWSLEFDSGIIAKNCKPGQFVEVKVNNRNEPLLRRPISIHGVNGTKVRLIYKVVGIGTQSLSNINSGDFLEVIGPLGNGFEYIHKPKKIGNPKTILVAGGMGVAPLVFLAEKLKLSKPLVLIGAGTKNQILCEQEFKRTGCLVKTATDDGSIGFAGKVTDLLKVSLRQGAFSEIYACGPRPMLKAVAQIACENNIASQLSLEEHMACGFGACLGCVVSTKFGYKRVCKDGPVFSGKELTW